MLEINKSVWRENIEAFAIAVVTILLIMIFLVQSFLVRGQSMEPTLYDGERLLVVKCIYFIRPPQQGEIVVLKPPNDPRRKYIKRVIAGPGETVSIIGSQVYVNGAPLREVYIKDKILWDYPEHEVPPKMLFVMGDNRNNSSDSRSEEVGFIPIRNVVGKALVIFWPPWKAKLLLKPDYYGISTNRHNQDRERPVDMVNPIDSPYSNHLPPGDANELD